MGAAVTGVVLHSAAVFAFLWLVMRVVGKREMSQMSAFDLVLVVVLGDLVTESVLAEALRIERVTVDDLREAARIEGYRDLDEVEWAVLEPDGTFSFFSHEPGGSDPPSEGGSGGGGGAGGGGAL